MSMVKIILIVLLFLKVRTDYNVTETGFLYNNYEQLPERYIYTLSIVFTTRKHNGLIFYASTQNSFLSVELHYGSIRVSGNFSDTILEVPFENSAGFGLANEEPHQIEIYKSDDDMTLIIDRSSSHREASVFVSSYLDQKIKFDEIYLGCHPLIDTFDNFQSLTKTCFVGCINVATWNRVDLLHKPYFERATPYCSVTKQASIAFQYNDSYIMIHRNQKESGINVEFDLLIYLNSTSIIRHPYQNTLLTLNIIEGRLQLTIYFDDVVIINAVNPITVNDAKWHKIALNVGGRNTEKPKVVFRVDHYIIDSPSPVQYDAGRDIKFGGYGFIGCIENLHFDGTKYMLQKHYKRKGISTKGCNITFQCNPNPCNNGGLCISLLNNDYKCDCPQNYTGSLCEYPIAFPSCSEMHYNGFRRNGPHLIDIDGVGLYNPVYATCLGMDSFDSVRAITQISPTVSEYNLIDAPRSWDIFYNVSTHMLNLLAFQSFSCKQSVTYQCLRSRITEGNITLMNWVGGDGQVHDYWNNIGAYGVCQCKLDDDSCINQKNCNCDNNDSVNRVDFTEIWTKSALPVVRVSAMDISGANGSSAKLTIGPLRCNGFGGRHHIVTFQESYTYLPSTQLFMKNAGSVSFEFKTDQAAGNIMLYSRGRIETDYLLIYLKNKQSISLEFNMGFNTYKLEARNTIAGITLDNNEYHFVKFDLNRKVATLTLNNVTTTRQMSNNIHQGVHLDLGNLPTYLGGTPYDPFSGMKGSIRDFRINGRPQPLLEQAQNMSLIGVHPGEYSACIANPDFCNFGKCIDHYNYFVCDCAYSPFYGEQCQEQRGITTRGADFALLYRFKRYLVAEQLYFSIGFATVFNGTLFALQGRNEFVFIIVNVINGGITIEISLRETEIEMFQTFVMTPTDIGASLMDGKTHVIKVSMLNFNLETVIDGRVFYNELEEVANRATYFNEPESLYVGGATLKGFISTGEFGPTTTPLTGCISGMKLLVKNTGELEKILIDPIYLYSQRSSDVQIGQVSSGRCSDINLRTYPQAPLIPYPPNPVSADTSRINSRLPLGQSWGSTVLGLIVFLFILILLIIAFTARWWSRNKGKYKTREGDPKKTFCYNIAPNEEELLREEVLINSTLAHETGYI